MEVPQIVVDFVEEQLTVHFLTFLRLGAFLAFIPGIGERSVPARVKLSLSIGCTFVITPLVPELADHVVSPWTIITEIVSGLILGISLRLFILALQIAGTIAAQATSLSQLLGSSGVDPLPAIGHILLISGITLALVTGLHIDALKFLVTSYEWLPVGTLPDPKPLTHWGITRVSAAFNLAFGLAAPFLIVSLIYNFALGAINKAMPQLMVAFVGAPLITLGGLLLLALTAPLILETWLGAFNQFLISPFDKVH